MAQQQAQFTQFMFNRLGINPAYAGMDGPLSLTFINRQQWSGVEKAPVTQTLSAHSLSKKKHLGLGLNLTNNKVGVHQNQEVLANMSYHLSTGKTSTLSMGMRVGVESIRSDYASLLGDAGNDPKLLNSDLKQTFLSLGAGAYFKSQQLEVGFSVPQLLPRNFSVSDTLDITLRSTHLFLFAKYQFPMSASFDASPGFLIKYLYGLPLSYDLNLNFIYKEVLTMGASYRKAESIGLLLKAQLTSQFQAGYAFDYPIGDLSDFTSGSHEIMVNYRFKFFTSRVSSPR
jgi:type IX secretion system PorP/SprF family membrane protein